MDLHNISNLLSQIPFFSGLTPEALRLIAFSGDRTTFSRGDTIFAARQKSEGGHLVLEGQVELFLARRFNSPVRTISVGGLIGEVALLAPTERPIWAIAATDCLTLKITRGAVLRVLNEFPEGAAALRQMLVGRVKSLLAELASQQLKNQSSVS